MTSVACCAAGSPAIAWAGLPAFLRSPLRLAAAEDDLASPDSCATDIRASLAGDGEAYERVVRRHQGKVFTWMRRFDRDPGSVEELVQDVFVEAYLSLRSYRFEAPFENWLRRIAVRVGYRWWKEQARQRRQVPLDEEALPAGEVRDISPAMAASMLEGLLQALSPADRLVVTLLHLDGLSVEEAAGLTGWSRAAIKVRAFRARRRLAALTRAGREPEVGP